MRCSSVLCSLALTFGIVAPVAVTAQGGSVAGIVVSRGSGAPVGDAQITVKGTALRAFTDASGRFHFDDVAGTTAGPQARPLGFRPATATVNVGGTNLRPRLRRKGAQLSAVVRAGAASATPA